MRISLARTKRLAAAWRRPAKPSGSAGPGGLADRLQEAAGDGSIEDWARYGGGLVPSDDAGRSVANAPFRTGPGGP